MLEDALPYDASLEDPLDGAVTGEGDERNGGDALGFLDRFVASALNAGAAPYQRPVDDENETESEEEEENTNFKFEAYAEPQKPGRRVQQTSYPMGSDDTTNDEEIARRLRARQYSIPAPTIPWTPRCSTSSSSPHRRSPARPRAAAAEDPAEFHHDGLRGIMGHVRSRRVLDREVDVGTLCVEPARRGAKEAEDPAGHHTVDVELQPRDDLGAHRGVVLLGLQLGHHLPRFALERRRRARPPRAGRRTAAGRTTRRARRPPRGTRQASSAGSRGRPCPQSRACGTPCRRCSWAA